MASVLLLLGEIRRDREALFRQLAVAQSVPVGRLDPAHEALLVLSLHHAYTSLEAILERIHRELVGTPPGGPDGHRRLLDGAALDLPGLRPRLLSDEVIRAGHALRGFRHVVRHAYAAAYDEPRLADLQREANVLAVVLPADLDKIEAWLTTVALS